MDVENSVNTIEGTGMGSKAEIKKLKKLLERLPAGYISKKTINGKVRFYLQWREGAKVKSKYIREDELPMYREALSERKSIEQRLRELERGALAGMAGGIGLGAGAGTAATSAPLHTAEESSNYMSAPWMYLKWEDDVVGIIREDREVVFIEPDYNGIVSSYSKGKSRWSREELVSFLSDRVVSRERRDIEKVLFKLGLSKYEVMDIAVATKAINAKDMLWLAEREDDKMSDAVSDVFNSVFRMKKDLQGDSVDTPEGNNIKRYGVHRGKYGIYKKRINPMSSDLEAEVAVYKLAKLMNIPCCRCYRVDGETVFSVFEYDFVNEHIVHFRHLIKERKDDELNNLLVARPDYFADFVRMIALDFVTRQDDRHLSNIAVKMSRLNGRESFYPLYDNGRSLFYEDTAETVKRANKNIPKYSTAFGPAGSYYDYIRKLSRMGISFSKLMNLEISENDIRDILAKSGLEGYRLDGSIKWIAGCLEILKKCES